MIAPFAVWSLVEADLARLVEARTPESRTLEFKQELPGRSDAERKEFLADVTSFANSTGGVIVYGVVTERDSTGKDTGVADALVGLPGINCDDAILRLEAMLRDGVDAPLTAQIRFQVVPRSGTQPPILVLGVFRSFAAPHQVVYAGSRRFWARGNAGKYEPDISELRRMFLSGSSWLKQADEIRVARVEKVARAPNLGGQSTTLIHVLPLISSETFIDLAAHESTLAMIAPLDRGGGWSHRFNSDGLMTYNGGHDGNTIMSYTQWFRTGGVEAYSSSYVAMRPILQSQPETKMFWLRELIVASTDWVENAVKVLLSPLSTPPPFAILITLRGILDAQVPSNRAIFGGYRIDQDDLYLPPVLYDPGREPLSDTMAPLFVAVAQSAGLSKPPA